MGDYNNIFVDDRMHWFFVGAGDIMFLLLGLLAAFMIMGLLWCAIEHEIEEARDRRRLGEREWLRRKNNR